MYVKCTNNKNETYETREEQNNGEASKHINFETLKHNEKKDIELEKNQVSSWDSLLSAT